MAARVSVTAEVVGVGSDGTEPSIVFAVHRHGVYSADKTLLKRYLFNCGEGTQRICGENGIKLNSLDALFLTRLSIQTASGIPGLVFALGGLGAASLSVHGPRNTMSRLQAMRSFVRRKYPQIECVVVEPSQGDEAVDEDIKRRTWLGGTAIEDQHARIVAVRLSADALHCDTRCWICAKCSPLPAKPAPVPAKPAPVPSSDDSSSSDEDSDSDESEAQPFSASATVNRQWLEAFYQRFEPAKAARADQILRQFAGREEQLRAMLLAKYNVDDAQSTEPPPTKKHKPNTEDTESLPAVIEPELPAVYADEASESTTTSTATSDDTEAICYVLQFRAAPSPVVWVIDCPSTDLIDSLVAQFSAVDCAHTPSLIVHFSPPSVINNERYQQWAASLTVGEGSSEPEHLIFDGQRLQSVCGGVFSFVFQSSARHLLRQSDSEALPSSRWQSLHRLLASTGDDGVGHKQAKLLSRVLSTAAHIAQPKLAFRLEEKAVPDYSATGWKPRVSTHEDDNTDKTEVTPATTLQSTKPATPAGRTLTILGTGSAAPSKLRASTSMYLALDPSIVNDSPPGILIDCGEGTYGQLERQFASPLDLDTRIAGLRCIWISHHHADHQCGLLRVLDEFMRVTSPVSTADSKLFVIAPESVLSYITAWLPDLPPRIRTATCAEMNDSSSTVQAEFTTLMKPYVEELRSIRVWHCYDAYGLILKLTDGTKIVYSGDTKPCDQLVRAGYDASILIHEATFDDTMAEDADRKKHSTVGQAIDVARRMRARRLVLTHFSQRYPSLPPALSASDSANSAMPVISAYDGIVIEL